MNAISAVAAVQARISAIETQLGTRRPAVDSAATGTATATTTSATTGASSVATTVTGTTSASFDAVLEQASSSTTGVDGTVGAGTPYAELFNAAGATYGVPPRVLAAIGYVESRYQTDVVSSAGAVGMMQFLPSTAASMGVDPTDPASAIDGAARYLRSAIDRFGNLDMAIASYNVGAGAVARSGIQPGSQAEQYTNAVLAATGRIQ